MARLVIVVLLLLPSIASGQIRGSQEAARAIAEAQLAADMAEERYRNARELKAASSRQLPPEQLGSVWQARAARLSALKVEAEKKGKPLAGEDWELLPGILPVIDINHLSSGDCGILADDEREAVLKVLKVSGTELTVLTNDNTVLWLNGFVTDGITTESDVRTRLPVVVFGTKTYLAIDGTSQTVFEIFPADASQLAADASKRAAELQTEAEQQDIRERTKTFVDSTGRFRVDAVYLGYANGNVTLQRLDNGASVVVPLARLSDDDRDWVKRRLRRRKEPSAH